MEQTITITLPPHIYQQLTRAAELAHQPVDNIISQSLGHTLPPLMEDIPLEYQADVYPLLKMSVAELRQEIERVFASKRWGRYEWLLEKKKDRNLTTMEDDELNQLRHEADVLTLRQHFPL